MSRRRELLAISHLSEVKEAHLEAELEAVLVVRLNYVKIFIATSAARLAIPWTDASAILTLPSSSLIIPIDTSLPPKFSSSSNNVVETIDRAMLFNISSRVKAPLTSFNLLRRVQATALPLPASPLPIKASLPPIPVS